MDITKQPATELIREGLRSRASGEGYLQKLSRDAELPLGALHDFIYNKGSLPTAKLGLIAGDFWGPRISFDADKDRLLRAPHEIKLAGLPPRKLDPSTLISCHYEI